MTVRDRRTLLTSRLGVTWLTTLIAGHVGWKMLVAWLATATTDIQATTAPGFTAYAVAALTTVCGLGVTAHDRPRYGEFPMGPTMDRHRTNDSYHR